MPGKAQDSPERAPGFGMNSRESLARWDRDSLSWRTSQLCLLEGSTRFSEHWPTSGMMRSGALYARPTWAPRTDGSGSSLSLIAWNTPDAGINCRGNTQSVAADQWSTPQSQDAKHQGPAGYTGQNNGSLTRDASDWSTPRAEDGERGQGSQFDGLPEDVRAWATPSTRDYKDSAGMATTGINPDGSERERVDQFPRQVFAWDGQTQRQSEAQTAPSDLSPPTPRRAGLNPRFALWLMGFSVTWLDSTPPNRKDA